LVQRAGELLCQRSLPLCVSGLACQVYAIPDAWSSSLAVVQFEEPVSKFVVLDGGGHGQGGRGQDTSWAEHGYVSWSTGIRGREAHHGSPWSTVRGLGRWHIVSYGPGSTRQSTKGRSPRLRRRLWGRGGRLHLEGNPPDHYSFRRSLSQPLASLDRSLVLFLCSLDRDPASLDRSVAPLCSSFVTFADRWAEICVVSAPFTFSFMQVTPSPLA